MANESPMRTSSTLNTASERNFASSVDGAAVVSASSFVGTCVPQNALDPNTALLWLTAPVRQPPYGSLFIKLGFKDPRDIVRTVGLFCRHEYPGNPAFMEMAVSADPSGKQHRPWARIKFNLVAGWQFAEVPAFAVGEYPYVLLVFTQTFGAEQVYVNNLYIGNGDAAQLQHDYGGPPIDMSTVADALDLTASQPATRSGVTVSDHSPHGGDPAPVSSPTPGHAPGSNGPNLSLALFGTTDDTAASWTSSHQFSQDSWDDVDYGSDEQFSPEPADPIVPTPVPLRGSTRRGSNSRSGSTSFDDTRRSFTPRDAFREPSRDVSRETPQDVSRDTPRDMSRDPGRDTQTPRDTPRDVRKVPRGLSPRDSSHSRLPQEPSPIRRLSQSQQSHAATATVTAAPPPVLPSKLSRTPSQAKPDVGSTAGATPAAFTVMPLDASSDGETLLPNKLEQQIAWHRLSSSLSDMQKAVRDFESRASQNRISGSSGTTLHPAIALPVLPPVAAVAPVVPEPVPPSVIPVAVPISSTPLQPMAAVLPTTAAQQFSSAFAQQLYLEARQAARSALQPAAVALESAPAPTVAPASLTEAASAADVLAYLESMRNILVAVEERTSAVQRRLQRVPDLCTACKSTVRLCAHAGCGPVPACNCTQKCATPESQPALVPSTIVPEPLYQVKLDDTVWFPLTPVRD